MFPVSKRTLSAPYRYALILSFALFLTLMGGCGKNSSNRLPDDIAVPPSIPVLKPDTTKQDQLAMCTTFFEKDDALLSIRDMRLKAQAVYNAYLSKPVLSNTQMENPSMDTGINTGVDSSASDDTTLKEDAPIAPAAPAFNASGSVQADLFNQWYSKLKQVRQHLSPSEISPVLDTAFYGNEFVGVEGTTELNRYHLLYLYSVLSAQQVKADDLTNKEMEELTELEILEEGIPQPELNALVDIKEGEHISPDPLLTFSAIEGNEDIPKNMKKYMVIAYRDGVLQQLFHLNDEALSNGDGLQGELPLTQAQALFFLDKAIKQSDH